MIVETWHGYTATPSCIHSPRPSSPVRSSPRRAVRDPATLRSSRTPRPTPAGLRTQGEPRRGPRPLRTRRCRTSWTTEVPTLSAPTVQPVVFPGDPMQTDIAAFTAQLGATTYWTAVSHEYGVGAIRRSAVGRRRRGAPASARPTCRCRRGSRRRSRAACCPRRTATPSSPSTTPRGRRSRAMPAPAAPTSTATTGRASRRRAPPTCTR